MSRFDDLLKRRPPEPEPSPRVEPAEVITPAPPPPAPLKGRPKGKKSDPDYVQVTAYIRRETYAKVQDALWNRHGRREFSDLVEDRLAAWLEGQQPKP